MATIKGSIPHQLGLSTARQRMEDFIKKFHQFGGVLGDLKERWHDDTLDFDICLSGRSASGDILVQDGVVEYRVQVPWTVALFAGRIKQIIEESGSKLLAD